uniref:Uncharacterized protein n=1 Tax=Romanomermis culicivorax TaxID=13658 RepID=A0A915HMV3_ROMCU
MSSITNENHVILQAAENRHLSATILPLNKTPKRAQSMRSPRIKQTDDMIDVGKPRKAFSDQEMPTKSLCFRENRQNKDTVKLMPLARNSSVRRSRPSDDEITMGIDPTFYIHSPGAKSDDGASSDQ